MIKNQIPVRKNVLQPFSVKEMCDILLKQYHKISEKQFLMYT
jgi:hypothetical protein